MRTYLLAAWILVSRGVLRTVKFLILLPAGPYLLAKNLLDPDGEEPSAFAAVLGVMSFIMSITYWITFRFDSHNRMPDLIGIPAVVCLAQYVLAIVVHFLTPVWRNTIEEAEQMQGIVSAEDEKSVLLRVVGE